MVHEDEVIRFIYYKIKGVKPMKWKYYWWQFRQEFLGGWEVIKELWSEIDIIEDVKATYNRLKEDDEYEALQKRYRTKKVLHEGDIITFRNPHCYGNEIVAKVVNVYKSFCYDKMMVELIVLSSALHEKDTLLAFPQDDIMNNIIQMGGTF